VHHRSPAGSSLTSLIYSLSGAIMSTIVMAFAYKHFSKVFSLVGISFLGGVTHNFTQVTVASLVLSTFGLYIYLPFLMIVGLFYWPIYWPDSLLCKQNLGTTLIKLGVLREEKIQ